MATLNKLFDQVYADALIHGSGWLRTGLMIDALTAKRVRYDEVFRWKPRPLRGYSHAHSRKIRREARQREPLTVS